MKSVYIIFAKNQKRVKIGRSNNAIRRFNELKTSFMDQADFCLLILTNKNNEVENYLHQKFADENIETVPGKEWFMLSSRLQNYLIFSIKDDPILLNFGVQFIEEKEWENMCLSITHKDIDTSNFIKKINLVKRIFFNLVTYGSIWYLIYDIHNIIFSDVEIDQYKSDFVVESFIFLRKYGTPTIAVVLSIYFLQIGNKKNLVTIYLYFFTLIALYIVTKLFIL